ncbi:hypothetical protein BGZ50_006085 [Haplosporangium sp. Z 11]|nr:hypothetical protein BGZ50_006085 [Haplosporangium sp. Z 11]
MSSSNAQFLARSRSDGIEKKAPPPIKPKPSLLTSASVETSSSANVNANSSSQQSIATVTDNGVPTSSSFGDLKRVFERQQNSAPLFMGGVNPGGVRASATAGSGSGSSGTGPLNHASISRVQRQSASSLAAPVLNNSSNSRPRSVSSPAPPHRDSEESNATLVSAASSSSGDGIDNSQPDFGNLRARFQSQASVSSVPLSKPEPPRTKPKPAFNALKPSVQPTPQPPALESFSSTATTSRFASTHISSAGTSPQGSLMSSSSRLSSGSFKQPSRPPPAPIKPSLVITRTPTPPRTPPPPRTDTPESERNPFMGSDEDEPTTPRAPSAPTFAPTRSVSAGANRMSSKIQQNPVFQQLNNAGRQFPQAPLISTGRDAVLVGGKIAPPPPQREAPRPDSPQGAPPKLPSRSNSVASMQEDTPEEKERKHRLDKRRRVVQELLETEISYSKDMLLLQEVYVTDMAASHLFTQADEKIIFTNLADVIALTLDFIALLTPACGGDTEGKYDDSGTFVGEAFLQMMSRVRRVFSEYCKRQEASAQHLQELDMRKDLKPFFEACTEKCKGKTTGWDLASLLIKPVQRVLKYPLLINQIHALTPPEHTDFENLVTVQKDMLQVAEEINEIKKRKDIVEKIVGSKKKNDSDIVYAHGFNKKFSRTTQQLRQAVGGSEVTVDILFEALLEKFNLQQRLIREFAKYIQTWLVSIKQFFDTQEAFAMTLAEIYGMVPTHRNDESQSITVVREFHRSLTQFSKTIGRELEGRLKKTVYKSMENFLKLFSGPLQVMKKREKKLLDYDSVRGMKERGETIDKNMLESAAAYSAINEQLVDELPKFLGLTTQYFDLIVMEFSKVQMFFYEQVKAKVLEYYVEYMDSTAAASRDLPTYLEQMNICEDYIGAMQRPDGPISRLERISLIRNAASTHDMAFYEMRQTASRRKRSTSFNLPSRPRSSSNALPMASRPHDEPSSSWHSKSASHGGRVEMLSSPTDMESFQKPMQPRYYPGEDENPFEMPESVFQDGSVTSEDYEPFGNNSGTGSIRNNSEFGRDVFGRPLSTASSSYSFSSLSTDPYQQQQSDKPPELDEGMDMDEIGIAQALFECTAIYPYSSNEGRQLSFEAGESIVVFGLNDNGWYFGKKIGKDATGWFPASHCIQI